jgi:hypothetical protein
MVFSSMKIPKNTSVLSENVNTCAGRWVIDGSCMADNTHHVNLGLPSAHGHPAHGRWAQLGKKNFPIISTLRRHGVHGPATHKRNSISTPIDGIWVTSGIKVEKAGYFSYDEVVMNTDHRCLWIDVPFASVFGQDIPPSRRKAARCDETLDLQVATLY